VEISSLASLGKVAGLGGIAVGAMVLLMRPIIKQAFGLPAAERAPTLRLIALGAFAVGALGIVAWLAIGLGGGGVTGGTCGVAAGGNASGNKIECGNVPGPIPGKP
jgi:O-antigen/teichoic acid export membrane protein